MLLWLTSPNTYTYLLLLNGGREEKMNNYSDDTHIYKKVFFKIRLLVKSRVRFIKVYIVNRNSIL